MENSYRPRGKIHRKFPRGRTYTLSEIERLATQNQLVVYDGRGGSHTRNASRLLVRDPSGKNPDSLFVRDYAVEEDARKLEEEKLRKPRR